MFASPLAFPTQLPPHIKRTVDGPAFDAGKHLALTLPERIETLADFGYSAEARARTPSPVAITSPFRVLSDEGVAALDQVLQDLKADQTVSTGKRLSAFLRGGVYRSKFLRDLVRSPELVEHLSTIAGTPLAPHPVGQFQAYVNYAPADPKKAVDNWHVDSLGFDAVLMVNDPKKLKGGRFQYFRGTHQEAAALVGAKDEQQLTQGWTNDLPADRVVSAEFPGAGYAFFMQGDYVFHRAGQLEEPGDRITVVPGYIARDLRFPDRTKTLGMQGWGDPQVLTEVARHAAWLGREKLALLLERADFNSSSDRLAIAENLEGAVADVLRIAREMREAAAGRIGGQTPTKQQ
jgi:hypothetical protein